MTATWTNLMKAQSVSHAPVVTDPKRYDSADAMRLSAKQARDRLYGRPGARPGANLPRTSTAPFHRSERPAVDFGYAMQLVCDDQQITPDQMLNSPYSAAIAARHMLWTVLFDGGHPMTNIARIFCVDPTTVALGIRSFRDFQKGQL